MEPEETHETLFMSEQARRQFLNKKYVLLKSLVPRRTQPDRFSIVESAIYYIYELKGTIKELEEKVNAKRCSKIKAVKNESKTIEESIHRSRKISEVSTVEVTVMNGSIKVVIFIKEEEKINCLVPLINVISNLSMEVFSFSMRITGDCHNYLFEIKEFENPSISAFLIAEKVLEGVDSRYHCMDHRDATEYIRKLSV